MRKILALISIFVFPFTSLAGEIGSDLLDNLEELFREDSSDPEEEWSSLATRWEWFRTSLSRYQQRYVLGPLPASLEQNEAFMTDRLALSLVYSGLKKLDSNAFPTEAEEFGTPAPIPVGFNEVLDFIRSVIDAPYPEFERLAFQSGVTRKQLRILKELTSRDWVTVSSEINPSKYVVDAMVLDLLADRARDAVRTSAARDVFSESLLDPSSPLWSALPGLIAVSQGRKEQESFFGFLLVGKDSVPKEFFSSVVALFSSGGVELSLETSEKLAKSLSILNWDESFTDRIFALADDTFQRIKLNQEVYPDLNRETLLRIARARLNFVKKNLDRDWSETEQAIDYILQSISVEIARRMDADFMGDFGSFKSFLGFM